MAWTDPRTWVVSEVVTAAQLNAHVRDNLRSVFHPVASDQSTVDVSNTITETTLASHTVTGGWMGANGRVEMVLMGDWLFNRTANESVRLEVTFGSIILADGFTPAGNQTSGDRHPWILHVIVQNLGATNSQLLTAALRSNSLSGPPPTPESGFGNFDAAAGGVMGATGAVDTTANATLAATAQWSVASSSTSWRKYSSVVQVTQL